MLLIFVAIVGWHIGAVIVKAIYITYSAPATSGRPGRSQPLEKRS